MNSIGSSTFRAIANNRKSCKRFQPNRTIPADVLKDIIEITNTSPSGFNLQPTNVILVQNLDIKSRLANSAMLGPGNVFRVLDSSLVAVFLSDLEPQKRIQRIVELEKKSKARTKEYISNFPVVSSFLMGEGHIATSLKQFAAHLMSPVKPMPTIDSVQAWSYKNTSLMAQTFVLAATSHGLSTCLMEGYDARRVKEILRIPDRYSIPLMCCVGYEYKQEENHEEHRTPRLHLNEVFFSDVFGQELFIENDK